MATKSASKFKATVQWSEFGEFIAVAEACPGLEGRGATRGEALAALRRNVIGQQELEKDHVAGKPISTPAYSGHILLRIPKSLHQALAEQAEADGTSLNQHLLHLLSVGSVR